MWQWASQHNKQDRLDLNMTYDYCNWSCTTVSSSCYTFRSLRVNRGTDMHLRSLEDNLTTNID